MDLCFLQGSFGSSLPGRSDFVKAGNSESRAASSQVKAFRASSRYNPSSQMATRTFIHLLPLSLFLYFLLFLFLSHPLNVTVIGAPATQSTESSC
ncbi:hypothetical protein IF2G_10670 [Cordyceps javanica]|nr:hypothetical protein IF2G_10670 [Cordyceps javanica]